MATVPNSGELKPPNCDTWKSEFARRVASKKISEEFQYFLEIYDKLTKSQFKQHVKADDAVLAAMEMASEKNSPLDKRPRVSSLPEGSKVCIVGAGMSGLYIAMILDALDIPNLSYEILEGSKRVGGRVYTHYFSGGPEKKTHDYYDVGAMRFPDIEIMDKTFKLFDHLGVEKIKYYLTSPRVEPENPKPPNQPSRYNDVTVIGYKEKPNNDPPENEDKDYDFFHVSERFKGRIMPELVDAPSKYVTEAFEPFKSRMRKNWAKGFNALMKYDNFSVRGFMMSHGITPLDDYYSIQWLETLTDGSGLYDQSFSEGVIDSMDFDYYSEYIDNDKHPVRWYCIDGGTQIVPYTMNNKLKKPLTEKDLGKRVTKIGYSRGDNGLSPMTVKVDDEEESRKYMTVFATPTLACLQRIDLTELDLLYEQKDAIRSLHYDTATKIGVQFKYAWWIKYGIQGGLGKTDMPIRTCVYPSYNLDDPHITEPKGGPAVLLCSYSWAQDAARIGSLIKGKPEDEVELQQMIFNNLTHLHLKNAQVYKSQMTFDELHKEIKDSYITHHAFDWHNHEFSSGAYGKFGPGQFANLYSALTCPTADSRFHFVGEAVSAHHGWIVGALDSAHQAVINFLRRFNLTEFEEKLEKMAWLGKTPDEIDRDTSIKKVVLGQIDCADRSKARGSIESEKSEVGDAANK